MAPTNTATISYDADMSHWPPTCTLVHLDPPLRRFDAETGEPVDYAWVAVQIRDARFFPENRGVTVFASTELGEFVHSTMTPVGSADYGAIHSVLKQLGYEVSN